MCKFELIEISDLQGKLKVFKLQYKGVCLFDEFEKIIENEGNLNSELKTIVTRLYEMANCNLMPQTKFKDITIKNDINKEYEIKTHHLRVYIFHDKLNGRIIVSGGKKGSQVSDIKYFRRIKQEYFNSRK